MSLIERLSSALVNQKGAKVPAEVRPPGHKGDHDEFGFIGVQPDYWGSVATIGLVEADGLPSSEISRLADKFHSLVRSAHKFAAVLEIYTLRGSASVKLGSFGTLCFVFERKPPQQIIDFIRGQKRGSAFKKEITVCWTIDGASREVITHRGLPLGKTIFPGKDFLEQTISTSG